MKAVFTTIPTVWIYVKSSFKGLSGFSQTTEFLPVPQVLSFYAV